MKFSIITAAFTLLSTATAASRGGLTARDLFCWTNNIENTTSAGSPLVTDCKALSETNIPSWTPSEANNYTWALSLGTCGFRGVYNTSGALNASEVKIGGFEVITALTYTTGPYAKDGRGSAKGQFGCIFPDVKSRLGFTNWEIYNTQ